MPMTEATFDENIKKLEAIVADLEADNLDLEQAIEKYEAGVQLVKSCQKRINEAELKIKTITKDHLINSNESDES